MSKTITKEEHLDNLRSTVSRLEEELARRTVELHKIEDVDRCQSCHTPGQKGTKCTACLGPTIKPAKDED